MTLIYDFELGSDGFLAITQKPKQSKKVDEFDFIRIKDFFLKGLY